MRELWQGRSAVRLSNSVVETVFLPGGGHIAEFRFTASSSHPQENTMWQSPLHTVDAGSDQPTALRIEPLSTLRVPRLMFLASVPRNWHVIEDARVERDTIVPVEGNDYVTLSAGDVSRFLEVSHFESMGVIVT